VYALGAILHECLCGQPLHEGTAVQEVMYSVMNREPVSLRQLRPELPDALVSLVTRCTSKEPARRPATTKELADLLLATCVSPHAPNRDVTIAEGDVTDGPRLTPALEGRRGRGMWLAAAGGAAGFAAAWLMRGGMTVEAGSPERPALVAPSPVAAPTAAPAPPPAPSVPAPAASALPVASALSAPLPKKKAGPPTTPAAARLDRSQPRRAEVEQFDHANPYGD
jgi:hypothetical protein